MGTAKRSPVSIIINPDTRIVMQAFLDALKANELEKSTLAPTTLHIRKGLWSIVAKIEDFTNKSLNAQNSMLGIVDVELDDHAYAFMEEYIAFWNKVLKEDNIKIKKMLKDEIRHPLVLIREILIRICIDAISQNMSGDHDGEKLVAVMSAFIDNLRANGEKLKVGFILKKYSKTGIALVTEHTNWIVSIKNLVNGVKLLHANKTALSDAANLIKKIEHSVLRLILAELSSEISIDELKYRFSDEHIQGAVKQIEDKLIELDQGMIKQSKEKNVSIIKYVKEMNLSTLAKQDMVLQLIKTDKKSDLRSNLSKKENLQQLYQLFNDTNLLFEMMKSANLFNVLTGWVGIVTGSIKMDGFSKLFRIYADDVSIKLRIDHEMMKTKGAVTDGLFKFNLDDWTTLSDACRQLARQLAALQLPEIKSKIIKLIAVSVNSLSALQARLTGKYSGIEVVNLNLCENFIEGLKKFTYPDSINQTSNIEQLTDSSGSQPLLWDNDSKEETVLLPEKFNGHKKLSVPFPLIQSSSPTLNSNYPGSFSKIMQKKRLSGNEPFMMSPSPSNEPRKSFASSISSASYINSSPSNYGTSSESEGTEIREENFNSMLQKQLQLPIDTLVLSVNTNEAAEHFYVCFSETYQYTKYARRKKLDAISAKKICTDYANSKSHIKKITKWCESYAKAGINVPIDYIHHPLIAGRILCKYINSNLFQMHIIFTDNLSQAKLVTVSCINEKSEVNVQNYVVNKLGLNINQICIIYSQQEYYYTVKKSANNYKNINHNNENSNLLDISDDLSFSGRESRATSDAASSRSSMESSREGIPIPNSVSKNKKQSLLGSRSVKKLNNPPPSGNQPDAQNPLFSIPPAPAAKQQEIQQHSNADEVVKVHPLLPVISMIIDKNDMVLLQALFKDSHGASRQHLETALAVLPNDEYKYSLLKHSLRLTDHQCKMNNFSKKDKEQIFECILTSHNPWAIKILLLDTQAFNITAVKYLGNHIFTQISSLKLPLSFSEKPILIKIRHIIDNYKKHIMPARNWPADSSIKQNREHSIQLFEQAYEKACRTGLIKPLLTLIQLHSDYDKNYNKETRGAAGRSKLYDPLRLMVMEYLKNQEGKADDDIDRLSNELKEYTLSLMRQGKFILQYNPDQQMIINKLNQQVEQQQEQQKEKDKQNQEEIKQLQGENKRLQEENKQEREEAKRDREDKDNQVKQLFEMVLDLKKEMEQLRKEKEERTQQRNNP